MLNYSSKQANGSCKRQPLDKPTRAFGCLSVAAIAVSVDGFFVGLWTVSVIFGFKARTTKRSLFTPHATTLSTVHQTFDSLITFPPHSLCWSVWGCETVYLVGSKANLNDVSTCVLGVKNNCNNFLEDTSIQKIFFVELHFQRLFLLLFFYAKLLSRSNNNNILLVIFLYTEQQLRLVSVWVLTARVWTRGGNWRVCGGPVLWARVTKFQFCCALRSARLLSVIYHRRWRRDAETHSASVQPDRFALNKCAKNSACAHFIIEKLQARDASTGKCWSFHLHQVTGAQNQRGFWCKIANDNGAKLLIKNQSKAHELKLHF